MTWRVNYVCSKDAQQLRCLRTCKMKLLRVRHTRLGRYWKSVKEKSKSCKETSEGLMIFQQLKLTEMSDNFTIHGEQKYK